MLQGVYDLACQIQRVDDDDPRGARLACLVLDLANDSSDPHEILKRALLLAKQ